MPTTVETLIQQANNRAKTSNQRQFAKKASNDQLLNRLTAAARAYINNPTPAYLAELKALTTIAERRQ